jgi:sarcosine oxidase subunit alpha
MTPTGGRPAGAGYHLPARLGRNPGLEGKSQVNEAVLGSLTGSGTSRFLCDLLVASAGQSALSGALSTVGAKFAFDEFTGFFLPKEYPPRVHGAGHMLGYTAPASIEASGVLAGRKAALECGADCDVKSASEALEAQPGPAQGCNLVHGPGIGVGRKSFVCFDEDGTYKTAKQSAQQGMDLPELAKRFGGFGLGPAKAACRGTTCPWLWPNAAARARRDSYPPRCVRPWFPTLMSTLAGANHDIHKRTPMHAEQERPKRRSSAASGYGSGPATFQRGHHLRAEIKNVRENVGAHRRLHPGQVPPARPRRRKGSAKGLHLRHEQGSHRQNEVFRHAERRRHAHRRRRGDQAGR